MFKKESTLDEFMVSSGTLFANIDNPEISSRVAVYGYNPERISEGKALFTQCKAEVTNQEKEYGEQYSATEKLNSLKSEASAEYMKIVKIARIVLRNNPDEINLLKLYAKRERSFAKWLVQAKQFYTLALSSNAAKTKLAEFGIDEARLTTGLNLLDNVEKAYDEQHKEMGEAQSATEARDAALEKLDDWLTDFVGIARIALEDNPQLIEMLGIKEPSI